MTERESCVLCACKHVAQARVLLLEALRGYPEHYWFAMGHLAEAEEELVKDFSVLADLVRGHRKRLEEDREYQIPFGTVILEIAAYGESRIEAEIKEIEKGFENLSQSQLLSWWERIQR